ncbi:hypothetical protein D3C87_1496840 [compost metagenome]
MLLVARSHGRGVVVGVTIGQHAAGLASIGSFIIEAVEFPSETHLSPPRLLAKLPWRNAGNSAKCAAEVRWIGVASGECDLDNLGITVTQKGARALKSDGIEYI